MTERNAISSFKRQPFYCEENIWHLCQEPIFAERPRHVVFISNPERACPMWHQRAGRGKPVVWDYHVILIVENPLEVWDLDTTLGLPVPFSHYLEHSFRTELPEMYLPLFRIIDADVFVQTFASDRSHMRSRNGSYKKPPPTWPAITTTGHTFNLMQFVDMEQTFVGEIASLDTLQVRFESQTVFST